MDVYNLTKEDMDETADNVKVAILRSLVNEGLIAKEAADEWAKLHTVITAKKSLFRTLSDLWRKEANDTAKMYWVVVKRTD